MATATLPVQVFTQAELDARTKPFGSRQLIFNLTTGELRHGNATGTGNWHQCVPVGRAAHTFVAAATTGNITLATALNNGDTIDGVVLATGDLVLVKDQEAPEENGIYVVGTSPARAAAYDTWAEHVGKLISVLGGTTNKNTHFRCNVVSGGTLNTTAIGFDAEPIGPLMLSEGAVLDSLPKLTDESTDLGSCQILMMNPATNQLCTIQVDQLAAYLGG